MLFVPIIGKLDLLCRFITTNYVNPEILRLLSSWIIVKYSSARMTIIVISQNRL